MATTKLDLTNTNNIEQVVTATPTASAVPIADATGKIGDGWVGLTTAGDVAYSDGTDLQRLGIGTAGQALKTNSGATAPEWADTAFGKEVIDPDGFSYTNSNAEQTIFSETIAGGTLGTDNGVEYKIYVTGFNSDGATVDFIFKLKYGSTTLVTITNNTAISAGSQVGVVEGILMANGGTSAQTGVVLIDADVAAFTTGGSAPGGFHQVGSGSATEDSTGDLALSVTVQIGHASSDFSSVGSYVRVIK